jgi:hypothetical protein
VCGSRAWARARLSHVTPEYATYASSPTSLHRESEQLQNLLSESPYLLRDNNSTEKRSTLVALSDVIYYPLIQKITYYTLYEFAA